MNLDDTIVAIASPPGQGARGIVRLSGPDAFDILRQFFHFEDDGRREQFPAWLTGWVRFGESRKEEESARDVERGPPSTAYPQRQLQASGYLFRGPHSYTGQDTVEIHTLGSPVLLGMIVERCLELGARRAEAGEFTARAFLAGKLDLSQVHAVAGMIAARSDAQLAAAERLLHGALSQRASGAREELADLLSLVEGAMDFADEPIEFITPADLRERLSRVRDMLLATVESGVRAERWGVLPRVLLVGPPNVGKSSLLNRLTGMDRAICAPVAGTTRDAVCAPLSLGEVECLLVDIAGFDHTGATELDVKAQQKARESTQDADLILYVVELAERQIGEGAGACTQMEGSRNTPHLVVANKGDLLRPEQRVRLGEWMRSQDQSHIMVSAATGEGCEALKELIAGRLLDCEIDRRDAGIAMMAEHRECLHRAVAAIGRALAIASRSRESLADADLVAAELRVAADELGVLIGKDLTEDMLGRIFSQFCVGK
ncbi:MAG TPA: tRNA modification GTPase [Phycisphaerae bacterium]|nr:tRNA modification GTPase [Phycisphaerae bacterium]